jgi:hypothetical protein
MNFIVVFSAIVAAICMGLAIGFRILPPSRYDVGEHDGKAVCQIDQPDLSDAELPAPRLIIGTGALAASASWIEAEGEVDEWDPAMYA